MHSRCLCIWTTSILLNENDRVPGVSVTLPSYGSVTRGLVLDVNYTSWVDILCKVVKSSPSSSVTFSRGVTRRDVKIVVPSGRVSTQIPSRVYYTSRSTKVFRDKGAVDVNKRVYVRTPEIIMEYMLLQLVQLCAGCLRFQCLNIISMERNNKIESFKALVKSYNRA